MAGESMGIDTTLTDGLTQAETWLTNNSDLLIQYGVNIISALIILLSVILSLKQSLAVFPKYLKRKTWIRRS